MITKVYKKNILIICFDIFRENREIMVCLFVFYLRLGRTGATESRKGVERPGKEESVPVVRCWKVHTEQYQVS